MPRNYTDSIKGRTLEANKPDPVRYNVAASPVDTYVAPKTSNNALRLAEALSTVNTHLTPYVEKRLKEEQGRQFGMGALGYLSGEDSTDKSESYQDGYLKLKWDDFGRQAKASLVGDFEKAKHDPNLDIVGLIRSKVNEDLAGIEEDPRAIEGYLSHVMPLTNQLGAEHAKYHQGVIEEESTRLLHSRMAELASTGGTPEEMRQSLDNDWPTWQSMGKTKKDMSKAYWDNLLATAEETLNPNLLDVAYEKDPDGINLASVIGADKVGDAKRKIEEAQKKRRLKDGLEERSVTLAYLKSQVELDPFHPDLDPESLLQYVGEEDIFNNDTEYAAMVVSVLKARSSKTDEDALSNHLMANRDPIIWKAASNHPEFKEFYNKQTEAIWAELDGNDPSSIASVFRRMIDLHELSGVPPRELTGLFGNLDVATVNAASGHVSPDLVLALQMYKAAVDGKKLGVMEAYTSERSMSYLTLLNNRLKNGPVTGESLAEAASAIKMSENNQVIQLHKEVVKSRSFQQALDKEVEGKFSGWFDFNDATNMSVIQTRARQIAEREVAENFMSPEAAAEIALERVTHLFTRDSKGTAFEVQRGDMATKEDLTKGMDLWLEDYAKKNGDIGHYSIYPTEDGKGYMVFSRATAIPTVVKSEELLKAARPMSYGTPKQRSDAAALTAEVKSVLGTGNFVGAELLKKLEDNPELTAAMLATDDLNMRQRMLIKRQMGGMQRRRVDEVRGLVKNIRTLTSHGNVSGDIGALSANIPAKLVDGTPKNVGELAKYYYKASPEASLAMVAEGLTLKARPDSNGALAVGFGYNFGARSADQVRKDLRAAGVATPDISAVVAGERAITAEQAIKLFKVSSKQYEDIARKSYGKDYDKLPPHVRAVLFDMAYNAGTPSKFTTTLSLFKAGKYDEASKGLTLKYKDENGKWHNNERRVQLWREMLSGKFDKYLEYHMTKKGQ
jgi:GH24 family phage-related lysozyme (muramidase)